MTSPRYILVVEDDADIRGILQEVLEGEGYTVVTVRNGAEALAHLEGNPAPFMILLDFHMPVMDGATFRNHQLANPALAAIPVAVLSADTPTRVNAVFGGVDVVKKPVDLDSLLDTVARRA